MKIKLITVSRQEDKAMESIFTMYQKRLKHYTSFEAISIKPSKTNTKDESAQKKSDAEFLLKKISGDDVVVLLDEKGKEFSSKQFASWIEQKMNTNLKILCFVIGGAYGFDEKIYARSNEKISLSKFTLPHQLAKIVFLEQLYRAFTILKNEKYHH